MMSLAHSHWLAPLPPHGEGGGNRTPKVGGGNLSYGAPRPYGGPPDMSIYGYIGPEVVRGSPEAHVVLPREEQAS
jgi:hypothetical protein